MIGAPGVSIQKPSLEEWRVFIQSLYFGARHLDRGTLVLYEVRRHNDYLAPTSVVSISSEAKS